MLVNSIKSPLAIGPEAPQFSWAVPLEGRGRKQSAYRLRVATSRDVLDAGEPDVWDSGRINSDQSQHVAYAGPDLQSNTDYHWSVELWDEHGETAPTQRVARFGTGLLDQSDWKARWIGMGDPDEPFSDPACHQIGPVPEAVQAFEPDGRSPMMATSFALDQAVKRARVYVCGLGLFELRLNGAKVGDDVLATPRTAFRERVYYAAYDVTAQLNQGENVLGILLGNGWFNGAKDYWGWQQQWHGSPRAIVQLEIELNDGSTHRVVSDESWRGDFSPITGNCLYDGETYDARLEQPGWDTVQGDRGGWSPVNIVPSPGGRLEPTVCEQGRIAERLRPVAVVQPEAGVYVFDLGRNMAGWVRLKLSNTTAGDEVRLRFGEAVHADGSLNNASQNRARQTDVYICRGDAEEVWEPRFTYHGFQYVEVTGAAGPLGIDAVEGCFVRTDVPQAGSFACGNELINHIHACTVQAQLCNVQMAVPTDDTQRPERLGWGADGWGVVNEAMYNLAAGPLFRKWLADFRDQQYDNGLLGMITPQAGAQEDLVWSAAFIMVAWCHYQHTGNRRVLEENYDAMQRYLGYLERVGRDHVVDAGTEATDSILLWQCDEQQRYAADDERGHLQVCQWGDHLATSEGFAGRSNKPESIATAFYFYDVSTAALIADALGRDDDAATYRDRAEQISAAFHEAFFDEKLMRYDQGEQSAQAWPLAFGMVPEAVRERVAAGLVRGIGHVQRRLTTGYAGTKFAVQALADLGRNDLVWQLATSTEYPSWGNMLSHGRTTACERWDGQAGSLNHAPLCAAIDEWFYWGLAGIRPDDGRPGFAHIIIKPYLPDGLPWAAATLQTPRGEVRSAWKQQGGQAQLQVTIPANATAEIHLPCASAGSVFEGGRPLTGSPTDAAIESAELSIAATSDTSVTVRVGSGQYDFSFAL